MRLLVIYDIHDDGLRQRAAEVPKDFGLVRVQYSAFAGDLSRNRRGMLEISVHGLTADVRSAAEDRIYVLPLCDSCFGGARLHGQRAHFPDHRLDRWAVL